MVRSRPQRLRAAALGAVAFALVLIGVVALTAWSDGRVQHVRGVARHALRGAESARARDRLRRRKQARTDDQVIERVRKVSPWISQGHTRRKLVALTFDDGPGPLTPQFIAELRRLHVPATFFQVAQSVDSYPKVARREEQPPFAVGSHTVSHPHLAQLGAAAQRAQIEGGARTINQYDRRYPRMFRPPYGQWNQATSRELRDRRMLMVLWSLGSRDWTGIPAGAIAHNVITEAQPGSIVLMHDFGGLTREPTLQSLPMIVHALRHRGYRFVTVPDMMRKAPPRHREPRPNLDF